MNDFRSFYKKILSHNIDDDVNSLCKIAEKTVLKNGISIVGEGNLPGTLPINASELFAKNVLNFMLHLTEESKFKWDNEDEITNGSLLIKEGNILQDYLKDINSLKEVNLN